MLRMIGKTTTTTLLFGANITILTLGIINFKRTHNVKNLIVASIASTIAFALAIYGVYSILSQTQRSGVDLKQPKPKPTSDNRVVRWPEVHGIKGKNPGWATYNDLLNQAHTIFLFGGNESHLSNPAARGGGQASLAPRFGYSQKNAKNLQALHSNALAYNITTVNDSGPPLDDKEWIAILCHHFDRADKFVETGGQAIIPCQNNLRPNLGLGLAQDRTPDKKIPTCGINYIAKRCNQLETLGTIGIKNPNDQLLQHASNQMLKDIQDDIGLFTNTFKCDIKKYAQHLMKLQTTNQTTDNKITTTDNKTTTATTHKEPSELSIGTSSTKEGLDTPRHIPLQATDTVTSNYTSQQKIDRRHSVPSLATSDNDTSQATMHRSRSEGSLATSPKKTGSIAGSIEITATKSIDNQPKQSGI